MTTPIQSLCERLKVAAERTTPEAMETCSDDEWTERLMAFESVAKPAAILTLAEHARTLEAQVQERDAEITKLREDLLSEKAVSHAHQVAHGSQSTRANKAEAELEEYKQSLETMTGYHDKAIAELEEARRERRTPDKELLEFANEVMGTHEVGSREYRLAEFVWVMRP